MSAAGRGKFLTTSEVAERLNRKPRFVRELLAQKKLRGALVGGAYGVYEADLDAYIESRMNVPAVRR